MFLSFVLCNNFSVSASYLRSCTEEAKVLVTKLRLSEGVRRVSRCGASFTEAEN